MTSIPIDILIVSIFLIFNLVLGIRSSKGVNTLAEFALGGRSFNTPVIISTIVATWIAGSSLTITPTQVVNKGLNFIIPIFGDALSFFIIAWFIIPKMSRFLGKLSVAEALGSIYGNQVRLISAISGIIPATGNVAGQFIILSSLLHFIFGIEFIYAVVFSACIVITYSTLGGIKAVTFTDAIQFITFGLVLPILIIVMFSLLEDNNVFFNVTKTHENFNIKKFFNFNDVHFQGIILLFLYFSIPGIDPALFQRISMSKDTKQAKISFLGAGFVITIIRILLIIIGIFLVVNNETGLNDENIVNYILTNYTDNIILKGFAAAGIIAMIMSTADSYINSSAVLFTNDFVGVLKPNLSEKQKLLIVRISSAFIGIGALTMSFFAKNLMDFFLATYAFYMPIVSVPLLFTIFRFKPTKSIVLLGMLLGFITVIYCMIFTNTDAVVPGMIVNLSVLFAHHYLTKFFAKKEEIVLAPPVLSKAI